MKNQSQFSKYKYFSFFVSYENIDPILEIYIRPLVEFWYRHLKNHVIKEQNRTEGKSNEAIEIEYS